MIKNKVQSTLDYFQLAKTEEQTDKVITLHIVVHTWQIILTSSFMIQPCAILLCVARGRMVFSEIDKQLYKQVYEILFPSTVMTYICPLR